MTREGTWIHWPWNPVERKHTGMLTVKEERKLLRGEIRAATARLVESVGAGLGNEAIREVVRALRAIENHLYSIDTGHFLAGSGS